MADPPENSQKVRANKVWVLFAGSFVLVVLSMVAGWFDTTTELFPGHPKVDEACLILGAVSGLLAGAAAVYFTTGLSVIQRIMLPLVITFETAIGAGLMAGHLASFVEGRIDFPAGRSHRRDVLLQVSRAYQTHGKGASQYIQTMPIWTNLEITREDYAFMRGHRRPGDVGSSPDEISSRGYFCVRVTIEEAGDAVRILHAGSEKLPEGAVMLCPAASGMP